jgi:heme exporter protein C
MNTVIITTPWLRGLGLLILVLFGIGIYLALVVSPPDENQGDLIRIMYAHVSVAWVCFLAVALSTFFGSLFLWKPRVAYDVWAAASAEGALLFAILTVVGGMTYSKPTLGVYWTWDAKLTLTALLLTLLVGYFVVRSLIDDNQRRGRVAAVIMLVVLVSLPFNYLGAEWFRTLHPAKSVNLDGSGITMQAVFLRILLFNTGVAALSFLYLLLMRVRVGILETNRQRAVTLKETSRETFHV